MQHAVAGVSCSAVVPAVQMPCPTTWMQQQRAASRCMLMQLCLVPPYFRLHADAVPDDMDAAAESSIMERRPVLLSAVPHEQPWATAAWAGQPVEPPTPSELQLLVIQLAACVMLVASVISSVGQQPPGRPPSRATHTE
jgi:hypothetical protein